MGVHIPAGFALLRLKWQVSGDSRVQMSTLGHTLTSSQPAADVLTEVLNEWEAAFPTVQLHNSHTFLGGELTFRDPGGFLQTVENVRAVQGTEGNPALPTNCALPVRKVTALGGRQNRGRMFLPTGYLVEADVDHNGQISGATRTDLQNRISQWFNALIAVGAFEVTPHILHSNPAIAPTAITSLQVGTKIFSTPHRMNN